MPSSCSSSSSHRFSRKQGVIFLLLLLICSASNARSGSEEVAKRCEEGLRLHGRGQWSAALEVFAAAVGDAIITDFEAGGKAGKGGAGKSLETVSDCVFGAALSLNTLGRKEDSLAAFRLAQRLLQMHPGGPAAASEQHMDACRAWSQRAASIPYMSCNSARAGADLLHDALDGAPCRFLPELVAPGSVVYVNALLLFDFFVNKHPYIQHRYVLVTHCSDAEAPAEHDHFLADPRLEAWFAQNPDLSFHPKLHPLPIGLANKDFPHGDIEAMSRARAAVARDPSKTAWLYVNVDSNTSPDRGRALEAVGGQSFTSPPPTTRLPFPDYLRHLASHRFVLCPAGNGLDTHRTWEALLLHSIPVVASSPLDPLLSTLPVLIVDDWDDITWDLLRTTWERVSSNASAFADAVLLAPYWHTAFRSPPARTPPPGYGEP